jgi:putative proteasome-type protease
MTYCVGLLLHDGLVMISDTRTNAGVDDIATFRKLHIFETPEERVLAIASAGNLSLTQTVLDYLMEGLPNRSTGESETLMKTTTMFSAAQLVGRAIREVHRTEGPSLEQHDVHFDIALLLGGQIKGGRPRLFMIYAAGNFIEASGDTPFLQIGEHKYGKPILDRAIRYDTDLMDGLKIGLISMDGTMRSNLAVGPPLDCLVVRRDTYRTELAHRITEDDPYFLDLRRRWGEALTAAHRSFPKPPYGTSA